VNLRSRIFPVSRRPPTWGGFRQCQVAASTPAHSQSDEALNALATRSPIRPGPRNRAPGSVPAMPPATRPPRNPWPGRSRPQGSWAVPTRRSAPPRPSTMRVHRRLMGQPGSGTQMATTRPEVKSPPGWADLANPPDHRAAGQSMPELDLRRLSMSAAAQNSSKPGWSTSTRIRRSARPLGRQAGAVSRQRGRVRLKGLAIVRMRRRGPTRPRHSTLG
jgi:hypothetical protein